MSLKNSWAGLPLNESEHLAKMRNLHRSTGRETLGTRHSPVAYPDIEKWTASAVGLVLSLAKT